MTSNAKLWVAALRSGEYKQCKRILSDGESYCCLGVACEIARKNGLNVHCATVYLDELTLAFDGNTKTLPLSVSDWLGFYAGDVVGTLYKGRDNMCLCLSKLNDEGATFLEIADIIEKNQDTLFVK